jgi:hypothetical protein
MESYQIVAGLSDLKVLFRTKTKTLKTLQGLELWCSFENDILWIHDYHDHKQVIIAALYLTDSKAWAFYTVKGTYGDKLLRQLTVDFPPRQVAFQLNRFLESFGFRISSGDDE